MKYKVHHFDLKMTTDQVCLEKFLEQPGGRDCCHHSQCDTQRFLGSPG